MLGVALFGSLLAGMGAIAGLRTACEIAAGLIVVVTVLGLTIGVARTTAEQEA